MAEHDPPEALFGGPDGTSFIARDLGARRRWLAPGGLLAVEHDDAASAAVVALLQRAGCLRRRRRRTPTSPAAAFRDRAQEDRAVTQTFDCADETQRATGIASAVSAVKGGRLVVLPTDTVYGVGADAFDPAAVAALLAAKGRGRDMPVPVLVGSWQTIDGLAFAVPDAARELIRAFWPGALSIVVAAGAVAAVGSRRGSRHGDGADAVAPGGDRVAARSRPDGGVEREHLRPPAGGHRCTTHVNNSANWSRSTWMRGRRNSRPRRRSSTSPAPAPRILREGPSSRRDRRRARPEADMSRLGVRQRWRHRLHWPARVQAAHAHAPSAQLRPVRFMQW